MYTIYNKEGSRLFQYGEHENLETAGIACAKALERHPRSGAHIRETERPWTDSPTEAAKLLKMVRDHFRCLRQHRELTADETVLLTQLEHCPIVIAELKTSNIEEAGYNPTEFSRLYAETIAERLGDIYRARHLSNDLYEILQ